jgi:hypothetical protein
MAAIDRRIRQRDREMHNAAIDETSARAGLCGVKHLPTGLTISHGRNLRS